MNFTKKANRKKKQKTTAFTDGAPFGFGAEIGISTQKLHARGPMSLAELCNCKWLVNGNGQTRNKAVSHESLVISTKGRNLESFPGNNNTLSVSVLFGG